MTKRAAITGHTCELGQTFSDLLTQRGYTVHGFSRSTGYDLRDYSQVSRMLEQVSSYDVFVNLAKPDYTQAQILYRLVRETNVTIINIGSSIVNNDPFWTDPKLLEYRTQKLALQNAFEALVDIVRQKLIMVHLDHVADQSSVLASMLDAHNL